MAKSDWYFRVTQAYEPTHSFYGRARPELRLGAGPLDVHLQRMRRPQFEGLRRHESKSRGDRNSQGGSCGGRASPADFVPSRPWPQAMGPRRMLAGRRAATRPRMGDFFAFLLWIAC